VIPSLSSQEFAQIFFVSANYIKINSHTLLRKLTLQLSTLKRECRSEKTFNSYTKLTDTCENKFLDFVKSRKMSFKCGEINKEILKLNRTDLEFP